MLAQGQSLEAQWWALVWCTFGTRQCGAVQSEQASPALGGLTLDQTSSHLRCSKYAINKKPVTIIIMSASHCLSVTSVSLSQKKTSICWNDLWATERTVIKILIRSRCDVFTVRRKQIYKSGFLLRRSFCGCSDLYSFFQIGLIRTGRK